MLGYLIDRKGRKRAQALLELTRKDGLQPGDPLWDGTPATHCNEYVYEAAMMCGYNIQGLMNPKGIGWTNSNDMYRNARRCVVDKELRELTYKEAQFNTNNLRFVVALSYNISGGHGHCAVVQRHIGMVRPGRWCRIVQAGDKNGEFWLKDIFDEATLSAPMFIQLTK